MKEEKSDMGDVMQGISGFDESMVADLLEIDSAYNYFTEPAVREAISELKLQSGSHGMEVGCGPGLHTLWLTEAVAPDGQVTGIDIMRALGWFKAVGLQDARARSFAVEAQAPLDENARRYVMAYLQSYEAVIKPQHLSSEDWADYQRLCQSGSPDFILNLPDYYCYLTYTLFYARTDGKKE